MANHLCNTWRLFRSTAHPRAAAVALAFGVVAGCGGNASDDAGNESATPGGGGRNDAPEASGGTGGSPTGIAPNGGAAAGTGTPVGFAEGAACAADAACASGFCDLGSCATPTPVRSRELYGRACGPMPSFAPRGRRTWGGKPPTDEYCDHLCIDGVCRSCTADAQCFELEGLTSCAARSDAAGRHCTEPETPNEAVLHPPGARVRAGTPVLPAPRTEGVPGSVRLAPGGSLGSAVNARLAVVWWHQRAGEFDEFLQVAYDVPLDPGATQVEIDFSDIALPYQENLVCWRDCRDRTQCPCEGYDFALGSVLVALDRDGDGALSSDEVQAEQVGATDVEIGWAASAQGRGSDDSDYLGAYLIPSGFSAYAHPSPDLALAPVVDDFDVVRSVQVGPPPDPIADRVFPLVLCPSGDAACSLPVTHLFCNRDCDRNWGLNRFGF